MASGIERTALPSLSLITRYSSRNPTHGEQGDVIAFDLSARLRAVVDDDLEPERIQLEVADQFVA